MSSNEEFETLPLESVLRINARCDSFETACRTGQEPAIEAFLDGTDGAERAALARHLAEIEFDYRGLPVGEFLRRLATEAIAAPPEGGHRTAHEMAEEMVAAGTLTRFQADALLGPREHPLHLDDYRLLERIGSGGMGAVYRALHLRMKREVALKVLTGSAEDAAARRAWFQNEVETAGRLHHPNIVTAFDAGEARGLAYLVTEYVPGADLQRYVAGRGPLPEAEAIEMIRDAAQGLLHAHLSDVIHRDVKPSNLIRTPAGRVRVLDVGLARFARRDAQEDHAVVGTPGYMAPEQAEDASRVDARADVYGLGATLFFLLTARPPFDGATAQDRLQAQRSSESPSVRSLRPEVNAGLDALVQRMLARRPVDRPASMSTVIESLDRLRSRGRFRKRLMLAGLGLAAALAAVPLLRPRPTPSPLSERAALPALRMAPFDAAAYQAEWARALGVPVQIEPLPGLTARLIPPGRFTMGTPSELIRQAYATEPVAERSARIAAEAPRTVTIEKPFYIGTTEVTVGQFRDFIDSSRPPYLTVAERPDGVGYRLGGDRRWSVVPGATWRDAGEQPVASDYPVCNLGRDDCADYCQWLTRGLDGRFECRLPTEAEWEYACRAGADTLWSSGADARELPTIAWFADTVGADDARFRPVALKGANAFGLFDMHGNLEEWCLATPPNTGAVLRGGNVRSSAFNVRSGAREPSAPAASRGGFRVVLSLR